MADNTNPETSIVDQNGQSEVWDWKTSGMMEMDCFLCHLPEPNNTVRIAVIQAENFRSASTATLVGTDLVEQTSSEGGFWNLGAFSENGKIKPEFVTIQDPTNENCAQCHEIAHSDTEPLVIDQINWQTAATGQVISPQRISNSGMNFANKEAASRSWDIHAERDLKCVDCHFSLNNPVRATTSVSDPAHLVYNPRSLDIGEYLQRPDHNLARGQSTEDTVAPELKGTMRRCESCHDVKQGHADWLPYLDRHVAVLACETCHIPQMYASAIESNDWTVITLNEQANTAYRGIEPTNAGLELASLDEIIPPTVNNLVTGFQPILL